MGISASVLDTVRNKKKLILKQRRGLSSLQLQKCYALPEDATTKITNEGEKI